MERVKHVEHVQRSWENISKHRRALLVELWTTARLARVPLKGPAYETDAALYAVVEESMKARWKHWTPKTRKRLMKQVKWVLKWQPTTT